MITVLNKIGLERSYFNIRKAMHEKPTANIILSVEKLTPFFLRSGTRQECPLSLLLFTIVLEILATVVRQQK